MLKRVMLGLLAVSSVAMAVDGMQTASSTAALAKATEGSEKGIFYVAKNFQEVAAVPGFTLSAPAGLVPGAGVMFGGVSGTYNDVEHTDGAMGFGFGYGNPYETVGGAVSLSLGSINPDDGGAFNRGAVNLSVGHTFAEYGIGVAAGMTGATVWHDNSEDQLDPSFYAAASKLLPNDVAPVILTAGFGNNAYADTNSSGDKKDKVYPFVSGAVYILPQVSLIADYTSGVTSVGIGVVPFPTIPVTLTMGAYDIAKQGSQDTTSFIGSISAAYVF